MFQIEQATKQCSKMTLTEHWDPLDIPQNSTFEDQYSIGGPQEQITVQEWSDRKSARSYETWIGIYTVKDCYPVQETFTKNYSVILSTRFFDIQLGIKDPSVFTPPSTCQMAQLEKMSEDCSWTLLHNFCVFLTSASPSKSAHSQERLPSLNELRLAS
ncbi:Mammalian ependymin- protein 1 [Saguinus oedipus]|uniref:Mammalian ependymin-related protein 1 n=1 Tax=Saguinus oedipus TaxID=9490 RepID=A0ABQ9UFK9_SAGOE|nr:Mammalian ependymin- protein 1 [Saguinus oedipus]